jgi:hypothetical protein
VKSWFNMVKLFGIGIFYCRIPPERLIHHTTKSDWLKVCDSGDNISLEGPWIKNKKPSRFGAFPELNSGPLAPAVGTLHSLTWHFGSWACKILSNFLHQLSPPLEAEDRYIAISIQDGCLSIIFIGVAAA